MTLAHAGLGLHTASAHWQTMVFTVLTLSQMAHVLAIRSETEFPVPIGILSNRLLLVRWL